MLGHLDSSQATAATTATRTNRLRADNIADTAQNVIDAQRVQNHAHRCHLQVAVLSSRFSCGHVLTAHAQTGPEFGMWVK